ncbi:family 43 glycosylhydrolase [Sphingobacterium haloxyli]|uniref:Arabinan endo-1,5-alpha-L-arabinosidase n=1 Tax=Sphingobacterium haloxyli TaxID=2100533 RepID=A0A2S9J8C8_9SPHI|nr:family 43 glycosylhydrolase [Sphingobacterium haloxyli]PRD49010.1 arabinan endo-1,5-alpha-L-arabinosidase [Sphingobacterium haloxyli]
MKRKNSTFVFPIFQLISSCLFLSCASSTGGQRYVSKESSPDKEFVNPVFEPILADPTVMRDPVSGAFYAYGTQDDWGDGAGSRLVPVLKSSDLAEWKLIGSAFETRPNWKRSGGIWAPEAVYDNEKYYLYYAFSVWDDPNPGIGVATSDKPEGPFRDHGKIFDSKSIGVPNSIDPFMWAENGQKYLFWGSFNDGPKQGTYGVPLRDDGLQITDKNEKFKIAAGDLEAVIIHKRNNYYYFIGSRGSCCAGVNSTYHMVVGRSENLQGPYLDKEGRDLKERGNGTLLLQANERFVGVGHGSRIMTDDADDDWILYHGIDVAQGKVSSGASRRMLFLDKVEWVNDWPVIKGNIPSTEAQNKPYFKQGNDE